MQLTKEELAKLQELAALDLSEEELEEFSSSLSDIVGYLHMLQEIDTSEIKELAGVTGNFMVPREGVKPHEKTEALLQNVEHELIGNSVTIKAFVNQGSTDEVES